MSKTNKSNIFSYQNATGPVVIPMTNDYLFKAMLQSNRIALTGLIASLLHEEPRNIKRVRVENPIILGEAVDEKTVILDLTNIALAGSLDRRYNIDEWATLFKAKTWEEIKMVAVKNKAIGEAAKTIYNLSEDERIRQQCEAREDYYKQKRDSARRNRELLKELKEKDKALEENAKELEAKDKALEENAKELEAKDKEIEMLKAMLAEKR